MRRRVTGILGGLAAVAALTSCAWSSGGTEALADEVVAVSEKFADILEESASVDTDALDDRVFTPLGRDYRQLGSVGQMVGAPRALLTSVIHGRQATVTMVLATDEHTEEGLDYEHSNAFTCLELSGTFDAAPNIERRNLDCGADVLQTYLGTNHFSIDELNYR